MISHTTIKSFQEVIREEFGVLLDEKDAREILANWVGYFDMLARIDQREK